MGLQLLINRLFIHHGLPEIRKAHGEPWAFLSVEKSEAADLKCSLAFSPPWAQPSAQAQHAPSVQRVPWEQHAPQVLHALQGQRVP
jgi:hypothetical protein